MSLFGRIGGWFKRGHDLRDPVLVALFGDGQNIYGISVTPETAMRVSAVYACVRILADSLASTPVHLYRRVGTGKERAVEHPLYRVVHARPNGYQSPFEFMDQMQTHLGLRGAAYAEIIVSPRGQRQMVPLHPDSVEPKLMDDYSVAYRVRENGRTRILLQDEVLRVTHMVKDGVTPISPLRQQRDTVAAAIQEQKFTANFFRRGGRPPGWLEHPSVFKDDDARRRFRVKFSEQFTGDNEGQTPLLEQGVKYNPVGISNEDAQLLELKKFSIAEIARAYRIPLVLLSETEKSTSWGTGIEQFNQAFLTHTMRPIFVRWEQAMSRDLLTEREQEQYFFEFNMDALQRADLLTRFKAYEIGRRIKVMSSNEVRAKENMNEREGGDEYDDVDPQGARTPDDQKPIEGDPDNV